MNCWRFVSSFFIITRVGIKECALLRQIAEGAWGKRIVQVFFFFIYYYLVFHIILSTPTAQPHIITSEMSCYVYIW